jgi:hypothetical protein
MGRNARNHFFCIGRVGCIGSYKIDQLIERFGVPAISDIISDRTCLLAVDVEKKQKTDSEYYRFHVIYTGWESNLTIPGAASG